MWLGREARACALVLSLGWLAACGGGGNGVTNPGPVATLTPAPVRSVVAQGNFTISAPDRDFTYFIRRVITTVSSGALETTVDWTHASNTVWMYLAEGECTVDQFASDACPGPACACRFSVTSEQATPKPRVLSVPNASAGTRALIVWNHGPRSESGSYQAVLTTTGAASTSTGQESAEAEMASKRRR